MPWILLPNKPEEKCRESYYQWANEEVPYGSNNDVLHSRMFIQAGSFNIGMFELHRDVITLTFWGYRVKGGGHAPPVPHPQQAGQEISL